MDLFKKTLGPVEKAMKDADLKMSEVDEVVLVGGSTRIPKVRNERFGEEVMQRVQSATAGICSLCWGRLP